MIYILKKVLYQYLKRIIHNLKTAAENNIIDAQYALAKLYQGNKYIQKDINKVI